MTSYVYWLACVCFVSLTLARPEKPAENGQISERIAKLLRQLIGGDSSTNTGSATTELDEKFDFSCKRGYSLFDISSVYSIDGADREWDFGCKRLPVRGCHLSGYANRLKGPMRFECPENEVIAGVFSKYDNMDDDRIFKFYCCKLTESCLGTCEDSEWSEFGQPVENHVQADYALHGVRSDWRKSEKDRQFSFKVCRTEKCRQPDDDDA